MTNNKSQTGIISLAAFLLILGFSAVKAQALPVSSCTAGVDADHFTCSFFPTNSSGNLASDTGFILDPPGANDVGPGYLVFLKSGTVDNPTNEMNQADWEEVLFFVGNHSSGTTTSEFELFTAPSLPSYATVTNYNGGGDYAFFVQNPNGMFNYIAPDHSYLVYTAAATVALSGVPEPTTVGLALSGCLLILGARALALLR